jgi:hypothetical protein
VGQSLEAVGGFLSVLRSVLYERTLLLTTESLAELSHSACDFFEFTNGLVLTAIDA